MDLKPVETEKLSPWWRNAVIIVIIVGFSILIGLTVRAYHDAPPIAERVLGPTGEVVFTGDDVRAGQEVFLKYGLMENGSIWGHGAYLGPDFSASYLHDLGVTTAESTAVEEYGQDYAALDEARRVAVDAKVA